MRKETMMAYCLSVMALEAYIANGAELPALPSYTAVRDALLIAGPAGLLGEKYTDAAVHLFVDLQERIAEEKDDAFFAELAGITEPAKMYLPA